MSDILQDPGVPFAIALLGIIVAAWILDRAISIYEKLDKK